MLQYLSLLFWSVPLCYIGSIAVTYFSSLVQAKNFSASSRLPSVTIYSIIDSPLFWQFSPYIAPFLRRLPFGWGNWVDYVEKDFNWRHKGALYEELGCGDRWIYWTVGPGRGSCANLIVADAEVIAQVVHRWKDFAKPVIGYRPLNHFGPNVITAEGTDWQRHRKITAPPFNEKNNSLVFEETVAQGTAMLASFTHDAGGNEPKPGQEPIVEDLVRWTMNISLHVLSGAAFRLRFPWPISSVANAGEETKVSIPETSTKGPASLTVTNNHKISFRESIRLIVDYLPFIILFPASILRNSPLQIMRDMQQASDEFVTYLRELIADSDDPSKISEATGIDVSEGKGDLLGTIVRAGSSDSSMALNEEETVGNIFIFVVAGHETTATAIQTALILLAIYPIIQQEVQAEIEAIWSLKKPGEDLLYSDYAKMRYILALMLETVRLYPAISLLPKYARAAQTIHVGPESLYIPAKTSVSIDIPSTHRNPRYWGSDCQSFRPSRWLMAPGYVAPPNSINESTVHENILCPPKGAFVAFSAGFRACLGKKFAQVEFCALIAVLLKDHSIELVKDKGRDWEEIRDEALEALSDRRSGLAMRMLRKVKVKFVRRGHESFPPRD